MAATTVSIQEFHDDICAAEEAAKQGPVFITDTDGPRNVLLSIAEYRTLRSGATNLADALAMPGLSDQAAYFEFPKLNIRFEPADLT